MELPLREAPLLAACLGAQQRIRVPRLAATLVRFRPKRLPGRDALRPLLAVVPCRQTRVQYGYRPASAQCTNRVAIDRRARRSTLPEPLQLGDADSPRAATQHLAGEQRLAPKRHQALRVKVLGMNRPESQVLSLNQKGGSDSSTVIQVNSAEFLLTPANGLMIVTLHNPSGADEAQLLEVFDEHDE
jgi:hypothetical protein